jgi:4-amino-4-deoxy-L-arabinose transferase-like glycosyltransferase
VSGPRASTPDATARSSVAAALEVAARVTDRAWVGLWAALLVVPLMLRAPLPPDELRYLSVAWEMWSRGDLVLPYLNGAPYTDKGPLLFWLMHAGWALLGVNDWWPRLLPGLLALTAIFLTRELARVLWPANRKAAALVPWLTIGAFGFSLYTQVVLVDLLLTNCTLLGILGFARADRGEARGWLLLAAGTALGLLTKGPVMFLHLVGPALLAPWWSRATSNAAGAWYARLTAAVAWGIALALLWAAVALLHGGAVYGTDVVMHQTADRIAGNFAHARPFWFYVAVFPALLLPWSAWPKAWVAARDSLRVGRVDRGARLLVAAIVPALVAFSVLRGKQPHYVLPLVPLAACLLASALAAAHRQRDSARVPVVLAASATASLAALPLIAPERLAVEPWSPVLGLVAAALALALGRRGSTLQLVRRAAVLMPLAVLSFEAAFFTANRSAYDTSAAAAFVRTVQDAGHPVAYARDYEGELHFSGRLTEPLEVIGRDERAAVEWSERHPEGYLVRYADAPRPDAVFTQRLRGDWLSIERARR